MDPEKQLENNDLIQETCSDIAIADPSTSLSCIPPEPQSETETEKKEDATVMTELQNLTKVPLVSPPTQAMFFCNPFGRYQHPIPLMTLTPPPAHSNSPPFGRNMNPMYSPFNFPYSYNPNYYRALPPFHARSNDLRVPPYVHTNNLPRARVVYRAIRHNPVYQPLLSQNNLATNIPQDLAKMKKKNATRHLCTACKKTYASPSGLNKHQLLHCPAGNCLKKSFTCKQCGEVCESFATYKLHTNTHTNTALQMPSLQ